MFVIWVPGSILTCPRRFTLPRQFVARPSLGCIKSANEIRKFLNPESTETIIHALVNSHLDCCKSPHFGIPKYQTERLQKVFNAAARLIFGIPKFDHISSALCHLHWLPVVYRVQFKLLP